MTQTGETPGFVRKVSPGQLSVTIHDLDDGFGGGGGACREYTRPRDDDCSVPVGWIPVLCGSDSCSQELQRSENKSSAGIPFNLNPASNEMVSDSVELLDTDVCLLHIQLMWTNVRLPLIHETPPEVDFESSKSQAKSESWNRPNLKC